MICPSTNLYEREGMYPTKRERDAKLIFGIRDFPPFVTFVEYLGMMKNNAL